MSLAATAAPRQMIDEPQRHLGDERPPGSQPLAWRTWSVFGAAQTAKSYRPDIDAMRALAVGLVIVFHLGSRRWAGGFVGVDVFFVISGYLIGSLILSEMAAERFSIISFYERRIRRILPALTVVLVASTLAAVASLHPQPLLAYGVSLWAAATSLSNFYFWQTTGYLEGVGTSKALLHTWSLAVEEQFYFLLPPFLMLIKRFAPSRASILVAATAAVSFLMASIGAFVDPNTTFYLPHTRAWELLLGVLLAMNVAPRLSSAWMRGAMALGGLVLIVASAMLMDRHTPFPGLGALPPCLGAAMVIWAHLHGDSPVKTALSFKPLVFIGLISYSLYLWHWPILVLGREAYLLDNERLTGSQALAVVGLTAALAIVTWLLVERPFRRAKAPSRAVYGAAAASAGLLAACGFGLFLLDGLPDRFSKQVRDTASYINYRSEDMFRTGTCFINTRHNYQEFSPETCLTTSPTKSNVLLIGDSYAAHLYYGMVHALPSHKILQATASGCKPSVRNSRDQRDCAQLSRYVFGTFIPKHPVDLIVIAGSWTEPEFGELGEVMAWARARDLKLVVVGRIAEYDAPLPGLIAQGLDRNDPKLVDRHRRAEPEIVDRKLAAFVASRGGRYASTYQALCGDGVCQQTTAAGVPLQFDHGHLTRSGSIQVINHLARQGAFQLEAD